MLDKIRKIGRSKQKTASDYVLDKLIRHGQRDPSFLSLLDLYNTDPICFYELGTIGVTAAAPEWAKELSDAAKRLRRIIQQGFEVVINGNGTSKIISGNEVEIISSDDTPRIVEFLHVLNDTAKGREMVDYEGQDISQAEIEFKMGNITGETRAEVLSWMNDRPRVIKLDEEDLRAIEAGMPGYVIYGLLRCVPEVLVAPSAVFEGLRGEGELSKGRAYCGLPKQAYDNAGNKTSPPERMVYVVYTDREGFVFDWDWVREGDKPGYPIDWQQRFGKLLEEWEEVSFMKLEGIKPTPFKADQAWYSRRGDCVFWYGSNSPAFAERVNDDLTVFKDFQSNNVAGCKVKNVSRLMHEMRKSVLVQLLGRPTPLNFVIGGSLAKHAASGASTDDYEVYQHIMGSAATLNVHATKSLISNITLKTDAEFETDDEVQLCP